MSKIPPLFLILFSLLLATKEAAAQPTITGIHEDVLPRSRRVEIHGSGFGNAGEVFIANITAWTTTWTESQIVAYVPETAPLGPASLHVIVDGQSSNEISLTVTERQAEGRVRWIFEADGDNLWWRPALAPNGMIYLHTNNLTDGIVYALTPNGALLWVRKVNWYPYAPPTAGPDGEVYVGSIFTIYRISPQGDIDWEFNDVNAQGIQVAPTIGPDGMLYGVFDRGLGAFSIDPVDGSLRWSNPGDPIITDWGTMGTEMHFGPSQPGGPIDQMYFHMDGYYSSSIYAFGLDGEQRWTSGLAATVSHRPAVGLDGTLYSPRYIGLWIAAFDPADGSTLWEYNPGWATGSEDVVIGPDDILYFVGSAGYLEAFDSHTQRQLWRNPPEILDVPGISPDGSTIIVSGVGTYGMPGYIKAFDSRNGRELWRVDMEGEPYPEPRLIGVDRPRFTSDSKTAYVSTANLSEPPPDEFSYLYAIEVDGEIPGITCDDISRFGARCTENGRLQFGVSMTDATHHGETVIFDVDGLEQYTVTIHNRRAVKSIPGQGGTGEHVITLIDPPNCFDPFTTTCD